ncbi:MAG: biopolymer transport protein ExbD [Verrucomicrobiota bacterium]
MRMRSPIPHKHARIEIIPLIDIMFFLLASFMMVSLSQTHMKGIRVNLPSANTPPPPPDQVKDYISIRIAEGRLIYFDNVVVNFDDVHQKLFKLHEANPDVKISISAETNALHGDVIDVLDKVRSVGITKIGYQIKTASPTGAPGTVPAPPGPPGAPPPPPKP